MLLEDEKSFLTCLYLQNQSQNEHKCEFFFSELRYFFMDNINNEFPTATVITGDFNDRCAKWCNKDITNSVGRETDSLTQH